jgi:5-(carboxyamino)imidazole ribonucleotide synthase
MTGNNLTKALEPNSTIGILGGGQLGRMLGMAGARLGYRIAIFEPDPRCPAAQIANMMFANAYADEAALDEFAFNCDAITLEFENIPQASAEFLGDLKPMRPDARALGVSQDRLVEKAFLADSGVRVVDHFNVLESDDLDQLRASLGGRIYLKTRRFGYDGRGQIVLSDKSDAGTLREAGKLIASLPCIAEAHVDFKREISVMVARRVDGTSVTYDAAENVHRESILRRSTVPATSSPDTQADAAGIAIKIANALDYVGVMGVEFFETEDGELLVNEIAPRVHNSGHWTEAACVVSQFEMHMRCVAGLPLPNPARHSDCVLHNIIGDDMDNLDQFRDAPDTMLHLYGKRETRPARKMGHYTQLTGPALARPTQS